MPITMPSVKNRIILLSILGLACTAQKDVDIEKRKNTTKKSQVETADSTENPNTSLENDLEEINPNSGVNAPVEVGGVFLNGQLFCEVNPDIQSKEGIVTTGCRFQNAATGEKLPNLSVYDEAYVQAISRFNKPVDAEILETSNDSAYNWHLNMTQEEANSTSVQAKSKKDPRHVVVTSVEGGEKEAPVFITPLGRNGDTNTYDFVFGKAKPGGCEESGSGHDYFGTQRLTIPFTMNTDSSVAFDFEDICGLSSYGPFVRITQLGDGGKTQDMELVKEDLAKTKAFHLPGFKGKKDMSYQLEIVIKDDGDKTFRIGAILTKTESDGAITFSQPQIK